jgi:hypothetical protein
MGATQWGGCGRPASGRTLPCAASDSPSRRERLNFFFAPVEIRPARTTSAQLAHSAQPKIEENAMQYILLVHTSEAGFAAIPKDQLGEAMAAYGAYSEALKKAGAMVGSNRLQPIATATTVRVVNGKSQVLNGPYAETKEQLGGYFLIEAPDLDAAISWAARCPGASHGAIEVRPVWTM